MNLAPIVLFVYNRPWHTRQTLEALSNNYYADQSELIVFADGPKQNASSEDIEKIIEVRSIVKEKQWCKSVKIIESEINKGLADSIVSGVTKIVNEYGKIIVLEDDIVTSPGFLKYMNDALSLYESKEKVMHISGYMFPVNEKLPQTFFYNTASCWGWGTWARAWKYFNEDTRKLAELIYRNNLVKKFNVQNSYPFYSHLEDNISGKIKTWAVMWYASFFLKSGFSLHPYPSLTNNIGHDNSGENCTTNNFFYWNRLANQISVKTIPIKESKKAISAMVKFNKKLPGTIKYSNNRLTFYLKRLIKVILRELNLIQFISSHKANEVRILKEKNRIINIPRFIEGYFSYNNLQIKFIDSASFLFMYSEIYEKEIYKFKTDSQEPFIIDCGANIGLSVLYFKQLYPNASIIAFEPDAKIFEILKENCIKFNLTTIELINKAVWNTETSLDFFSEGADGGRIALESDKEKLKQIKTVRLKDYLIKQVDFLKIDIEGAETNVIMDCEDELRNVKFIFIEFHSFFDQEQKLDTILSTLKKSGFRLHINNPGFISSQPFIKREHYLNMDMQLNVYGFRN